MFLILGANNVSKEITIETASTYKEAYQKMMDDLQCVKEDIDTVEENISDDAADVYDGNDLYYWNIKEI